MRKVTCAAALLPLLAMPVSAQTGPGGDGLSLSGEGGLFRAAGYEIDIDEVRLTGTGGAILSGATLTRPGLDGYVLIRQMEMPDPGLLAQVLSPTASCDPTDASSGKVVAREVRFRPDSDLGVSAGQEEIRIPLLTIDTSRIGCSWRMSATADAVLISGVDGSRIDITTAEARVRLSGPEMRELDARVDLFGIGLNGADGPGGLRAGEAGLSFAADLSDGGLLARLSADAPLAELITIASGSVLRGGLYVRDLELIPDLFLPAEDRARTGIDGPEPIRGGLELTAGVEMGALRFRGASDLGGVVRGELDLVGALPPPGGLSLPAALSGSVPVPAELVGFTVERASFRYQDLGVAKTLSDLSGRGPEELANRLLGDRIGRVADRLPGGLPATVRAGWDAILSALRDGRGSAGVRPEQPFSLLELAVSGMMGPDSAVARTGAWRQD
jgi:hypothetical protein